MLQVRRSADRGFFDHGWLKTYHTFSFADYHDPHWVDFGPLRVINDDLRAPRARASARTATATWRSSPTSSRASSQHQDSMGNGSVIRAGRRAAHERRHRRACTASSIRRAATAVHLLQIWIRPEAERLPPGYEQKHFTAADKRGAPAADRLAATARRARCVIHQDARVYAGLFDGAERADYALAAGRRAWVHVARGALSLDDTPPERGRWRRSQRSGAARAARRAADAEVLLFDLP